MKEGSWFGLGTYEEWDEQKWPERVLERVPPVKMKSCRWLTNSRWYKALFKMKQVTVGQQELTAIEG